MEMVGGTLAEQDLHDSTAFAVTVIIEEVLELLGLVLLLHTLMMHAFVDPAAVAAPAPATVPAAAKASKAPKAPVAADADEDHYPIAVA